MWFIPFLSTSRRFGFSSSDRSCARNWDTLSPVNCKLVAHISRHKLTDHHHPFPFPSLAVQSTFTHRTHQRELMTYLCGSRSPTQTNKHIFFSYFLFCYFFCYLIIDLLLTIAYIIEFSIILYLYILVANCLLFVICKQTPLECIIIYCGIN